MYKYVWRCCVSKQAKNADTSVHIRGNSRVEVGGDVSGLGVLALRIYE
jgi:hypothetical protein